MQDDLARDLNQRFGDTNWWQIVPIPLADYPIGTILDRGISTSTNCVFASSVLENLSVGDRIPQIITNTTGFSLQLKSPTNITAATAGLAVDYKRSIYVSYTRMTLQSVVPDVYSKTIESESECKRTLRDRFSKMPDASLLVGYLKGQFQLSASHNFDIDLTGAAYGANGTLAYTNSGGWTVLETNSVPCFAVVATPKLETNKSTETASILKFERPNYTAAAGATDPRHEVRIQFTTEKGELGCHFSRVAPNKLKFIARDDDTHFPVTRQQPLDATINHIEGGRNKKFVFDISDFRKNPAGMKLVISIDGVVQWSGHGDNDNIRNWHIEKVGTGLITISPGGDRELRLKLD